MVVNGMILVGILTLNIGGIVALFALNVGALRALMVAVRNVSACR
jgi:hypothetical protein